MGLYDFLSKTKKKVGEAVSSLGATARRYSNTLKDTLNSPAPKILQNTLGKLPDAYTVAKPAYDFLGGINTRPLSSRASSPLGKLAGGIVETPYTFLTSVPKTYGNTMNEIGKGTIFSKGGIKRTAGRVLESGLDTASMGLLGKGAKVFKEAVKAPTRQVITSAIRQGAKTGMKFGAGYGAGYGVSGALQEDKGTWDTIKDTTKGGATGALIGGVLGGGITAAGSLKTSIKNSIQNRRPGQIIQERIPAHLLPDRTVRNAEFPIPAGHVAVGPSTHPAGYDRSGFSVRDIPGVVTKKLLPAQSVERGRLAPTLTDWRKGLGEALPRPGMSIEDVSNKNTRAINAVNAEKNAAAKEAVAKMARGAPRATKTPEVVPDATPTPKASPTDGIRIESGTPEERFAKSLDEIPTPWGERAETKLAKELGTMEGGYNKYQQKAFEEKGKRIKSIEEVLNAPTKLRAMGFTKAEAQRLGVKEAGVVAKLGELGYPKGHPFVKDPYSEQTKRAIDQGVRFERLKDYYDRKKALDTDVLKDIDPESLKDISALQAGSRDVYRNFETVFGGKYNDPKFQKVKKELLDPFDEAKGNFVREQKDWLGKLDAEVVQKLGIKKGSKLSAAVQKYGEGEMTLDELKNAYPKDWKRVVEADKWFRSAYDGMLDELNRVREFYYPTHPLYPESTKVIPKRKDYYRHFTDMMDGFPGLRNIFETPANIDPALAVSSEYTKPGSRWLSFAQKREGKKTAVDAVGGFLDYLKAASYAKHIDPHIQRFRGVDKEAANLVSAVPNDRIGLAEELSKKIDPFERIAESAKSGDAQSIAGILAKHGMSEKQSSWMAKELASMTDISKMKAFVKEKTNKNAENIMEKLSPSALAEGSENKLNNFLKFLDDFSNDLAGKTNPFDRPFQDKFFGRPAFRAIDWANNKVKINVILGNIGSALAQPFSIPSGIANAGAKNSLRAVGDSLAGVFSKRAPAKQSNFLTERFFNGYDQFDPGVLANTKRFAVWMTSVGDKIGATFTWNAQYRKALSEGMNGADAIKYADDWTRKLVAGRGVGEVPIVQKSKLGKIIAPFQLEVANQWRVFGDWARNDPTKLEFAKKMITYSATVWAMNRVVKELRGSDVAFDPIQAMLDAKDSWDESESAGEGAIRAGGRIAGEVLSNMPGGSTIAALYPEFGKKDVLGTGYNLPTREKVFGDKDPTRFGNGLLAGRALLEPQYMLFPPFGGRQIKNTLEGGNTLRKGFAETASGKVMTPVEATPYNTVKGLLFGKNALNEVKEYRESDANPLGEKQDKLFRDLPKEERNTFYNTIMTSRAADREKEAIKAGKEIPSVEIGEGMRETDSRIHRLSDGTFYVPSLEGESKTFRKESDAKFAIEREDFIRSGERYRDLGDTVLLLSADGDVSKKTKEAFTAALNGKRMNIAKDRKDYEGWAKNAKENIWLLQSIVNRGTLNPIDQMEAEDSLATLLRDFHKFESYGGAFTKPKKGRQLEEKFRYPLVDTEMIKVQSLLSGANSNAKPRVAVRPLRLIPVRLRKMSRYRRRRK